MKWKLQEEVLLVDLYYKIKNGSFSNLDNEIDNLSSILKKRAELLRQNIDDKFRNSTGIKMKLHNVDFVNSNGKSGLSAYSLLDKEVVNMYKNNKKKFDSILKSAQDEYHILSSANFQLKPVNNEKTYFSEFGLNEMECPDIKIDSFNLTIRTSNCFNKEKIFTLKDLLKYNDIKLIEIRNFGEKCIKEVKEKIINSDVLYKIFNCNCIIEDSIKQLYPEIVYKNVEKIVAGDFSFLEEVVCSDIEIQCLNEIKESVDIIDKDLRMRAYNEPSTVIPIIGMFSEFYMKIDMKNRNRDKIADLVLHIPTERRNHFLFNYIYAFGCSDKIINIVKQINIHMKVIDLIDNASMFSEDSVVFSEMSTFLKWMTFDITEIVKIFFTNLFSNDHIRKVIYYRTKDETLESVGKVIGVTRERIRQIEAKAQLKFNKWYTYNKIFLMLVAIRNNDQVLTFEEIDSEVKEYSKELIYFLKKCGSNDFIYDTNLNVFIVKDSKILDGAEEFVDLLPDEFSESLYNKYLESATNKGINEELIIKLVNNKYQHTNSLYHRKRLTLTSIYVKILEKYYSDGMKIFDENELVIFKKHICEEYGDVNLPGTSRAISARIADIGMLCDRGTYMPKKKIYISEDLKLKIHEYIINSKRDIFLTNTLFSVFEESLILEGICNKYYLQGILRESFGDEFIYKRDYILKNNNETSMYSEIVKYIKEQEYPISQREIVEEFPGITDIIINYAVSEPEVVNLFGKYIHISSLSISDDIKNIIHSTIKNLISDGLVHHAKELYGIINMKRPDIWRILFIESPFASFSLAEALSGDEFEFKRPYFAIKGVQIEHAYERLLEFVNAKNIIEISEILGFAKENNYLVYSILNLLNSFNNTHMIIDKEIIAKIDYLGINENIARMLEDLVLNDLNQFDTLPLKSLPSLHQLPNIKYAWTEWLIYSTLKKYAKFVEVGVTYNQFRYAIPIVAKKGKLDIITLSKFSKDEIKSVDNLDDIDALIEEIEDFDL